MLLKTPEGFIEVKEFILHPVRFHIVNGKIFKENLSTKEIVPIGMPVLLTVNKATGAIEQDQQGFFEEYEVVPPVHPDAAKIYVQTYDDKLPSDFKDSNKNITYMWDGTKLKKK